MLLFFLLAAQFCEAVAGTAVWRIEFLLLLSSAFLSFVLEQLVMSFRRESCIRRGYRHEPVLIGCRIHPETCVLVRRVSRLAEPGVESAINVSNTSCGPAREFTAEVR